jgi:hypothetical protein
MSHKVSEWLKNQDGAQQFFLEKTAEEFNPEEIIGEPPPRPAPLPSRTGELTQMFVLPALAGGLGFGLGRVGTRAMLNFKPARKWAHDKDFLTKKVIPLAAAASVGAAAYAGKRSSEFNRQKGKKRKQLKQDWAEYRDYYRRLRELMKQQRTQGIDE